MYWESLSLGIVTQKFKIQVTPAARCSYCAAQTGETEQAHPLKNCAWAGFMPVWVWHPCVTEMSVSAHSSPVSCLYKRECLVKLSSRSDSTFSRQKVLFDTLITCSYFSNLVMTFSVIYLKPLTLESIHHHTFFLYRASQQKFASWISVLISLCISFHCSLYISFH